MSQRLETSASARFRLSQSEPRREGDHAELANGYGHVAVHRYRGSTRLLHQLGERYASVLVRVPPDPACSFRQWNGYEVDTQGDAFFVAFARATDAISAAVAAQRALASHTFPEGVAVQVRVGLHTGEPQRTADGYVGLDVHHAARIMSAGHGGQVLLSQATRELVEHNFAGRCGLTGYR